MEKVNGEISTMDDSGNQVVDSLIIYSEEEKQNNEINAANAKLLFTPKFIPINPGHLKFLTPTEAILFGFIDFYASKGTGRFYFMNTQLAELLNCSPDTVSLGIKKLEKIGFLKTSRKIKARGGQIRFIELKQANFPTTEIPKSDYGNSHVATTEIPTTIYIDKNLYINKNKINNTNAHIDFFKQCWLLYPRKKGKGAAEAAFKKLKQEVYPKVLDALQGQVKGQLSGELRYVPHFSTWLNERRWEDEIEVDYEKVWDELLRKHKDPLYTRTEFKKLYGEAQYNKLNLELTC